MSLPHRFDHRHGAGLAALAQNCHAVDRADGRARALDRQRLRDAQSNAIKQRQHGGVARQDPGLASLAGARLLIDQIAGVGDR